MSISTTTIDPANFPSCTEPLQLAAQNLAQRLLQLSADPQSSLDEIGKVQRALSGLFRTITDLSRPQRRPAPKAAPAPTPPEKDTQPEPALKPVQPQPPQNNSIEPKLEPESEPKLKPAPGLDPGTGTGSGSGSKVEPMPNPASQTPSGVDPSQTASPKATPSHPRKTSGPSIPPAASRRPKNQNQPPPPKARKPHKRLQRMMKRYRRR